MVSRLVIVGFPIFLGFLKNNFHTNIMTFGSLLPINRKPLLVVFGVFVISTLTRNHSHNL